VCPVIDCHAGDAAAGDILLTPPPPKKNRSARRRRRHNHPARRRRNTDVGAGLYPIVTLPVAGSGPD